MPNDQVQGQPAVDPATPQGQGQPPVAPAAQIDLTPYLPDSPPQGATDPAAPPQEPQGQPQIPPDAPHFQTLYNQTLAEKYALEQQLRALTQAPPQPQNDPRPDPQTNWPEYLRWEIRQGQRELLQQFREEEKRNWQGALQQASDMEWARQHPNLDINQVKAFAQARQIGNLDDAATLMMLPQTVNSIQRAASNQTMNNFRQPAVNYAAPIRPGGGTQGPTGLVFAKLAQEYQESFGKAYDTWTPEMRQAFDKEWGLREMARGNGR